MDKAFDVAVAYRIYPKISKNPFISIDDKYELAALCLSSFKNALGSLNAKIYVLLDNCPDNYKKLFLSNFREDNLTLLDLPGVGNRATFAKQIEVLLDQNYSDFLYFAEDDYLYLENSIEVLISFLREKRDVDFLTPYDHRDYYSGYFHKNLCSIRLYNEWHWRTANSTTLTFLTKKNTLRKVKKVLLSYVKGCHDSAMWASLTKRNVTNPFYLLKFGRKDPFLFRIYYLAWRYNFWNIILGKRYKIWVPIPAFATHVENDFLSPSVHWLDFARDIM